MTVGDVCTRLVVTADSDDTIVEAARRMRDRHVGDLVVVDSTQRPVGILTDRDIVVSAVAQSYDRLDGLRVGDVMTPEPATALAGDALDEALKRMRGLGVRRLPVVTSDGSLTGILAIDDVIDFLAGALADASDVTRVEMKRERTVRGIRPDRPQPAW